MNTIQLKAGQLKAGWRQFLAGLPVIVAAAAMACGSSAPGSLAPAVQTGPVQRGAIATPMPVPPPGPALTAHHEIVFVTQEEPDSLGAWSAGCAGNVTGAICGEIASDPFTWIDGTNFEVVPLSGVESWSQQGPDRWRFNLREGVTFHNGEPWNAEAARKGLDYAGDGVTSGHGLGGFRLHGAISGDVVDEFTVDVVCETACPIFPRSAIFTTFQAPEWWDAAAADERAAMTIGLGPYRIVRHVPGVEVQLEAFEGYKASKAFEGQAPTIKTARQVWRLEPLVRAAMIESGEGHWAADIGFENIPVVPVFKAGGNNEVFTLVADNIWHPELRKKDVRKALAHSVDCKLLTTVLYRGLQQCIGNISQWGTVGINESNSSPYEYMPEMSRQLLASGDYYHANYDAETNNYGVNPVIRIHTRAHRVYRGLEMLESVVAAWRELGVNAELVVLNPAKAHDVRRSGCGALEGAEVQLDCVNQDPPGVGYSTHYYETVTSNVMLDLQRQLLLRNSCHGVNSRVCNLVPGLEGMTFQESIADAIGTPTGKERQRKMAELAQLSYDEYWFLPFFVPAQVYGLAHNLKWEPRHDQRIRLNTMSFAEP